MRGMNLHTRRHAVENFLFWASLCNPQHSASKLAADYVAENGDCPLAESELAEKLREARKQWSNDLDDCNDPADDEGDEDDADFDIDTDIDDDTGFNDLDPC